MLPAFAGRPQNMCRIHADIDSPTTLPTSKAICCSPQYERDCCSYNRHGRCAGLKHDACLRHTQCVVRQQGNCNMLCVCSPVHCPSFCPSRLQGRAAGCCREVKQAHTHHTEKCTGARNVHRPGHDIAHCQAKPNHTHSHTHMSMKVA